MSAFEITHNDKDNDCDSVALEQVGIVIGCSNCTFTIYSWSNLDGSRNKEISEEEYSDPQSRSDWVMERATHLSDAEKQWAHRAIVKEAKKQRIIKENLEKIKKTRKLKKFAKKVYPCIVGMGWNDCDFEGDTKSDLEQHWIRSHTQSDLNIALEKYERRGY